MPEWTTEERPVPEEWMGATGASFAWAPPRWDFAYCGTDDSPEIQRYLEEGWEPFFVTPTVVSAPGVVLVNPRVYFRRSHG